MAIELDEERGGFGGPGMLILEHRRVIGLFILAITAFMGYWAAQLRMATHFEDYFPANHPNTILYSKYKVPYGGAQTLLLMLRVRRGDIFNSKTLRKIQDITDEVNAIRGVAHNGVFSLYSNPILFVTAVPGGATVMQPVVPKTRQELDELRSNVDAHRDAVDRLLTSDNKAALIRANFKDEPDDGLLFIKVRKIIEKYSDANTEIFVTGQPIISGWGYNYLPWITAIFIASIVLIVLMLSLCLGYHSTWWAPMLTASFSAIWGLGFVSLLSYGFDPVMMVMPLFLIARDLSHGIQWQRRYYNELERLDDKLLACATTTELMLPPGLLSIGAEMAGLIFISFCGSPMLKQTGISAAIWLMSSLTMAFVFQPIFMSYLPRPLVGKRWWWRRTPDRAGFLLRVIDWPLRTPATAGAVCSGMLAAGQLLTIFGAESVLRAPVGDDGAGTPLYEANTEVNQDNAAVARSFPTDEGWIVLSTPEFPDPQSGIAPNVLRMVDDLEAYLLDRGNATAAVAFANNVIGNLDAVYYYGFPKSRSIPSGYENSRLGKDSTTDGRAADLWYSVLTKTAAEITERSYAFAPNVRSSCIRVRMPDHSYDRLNRLRQDIKTFEARRLITDPTLREVKMSYLGGMAGLYLAADDVLKKVDLINIIFALVIIYLCCVVTFRSLNAGALLVISTLMANLAAFVYLNARHIGLTIDTLPVISLGIGLGVDYGIYTAARIRDEVRNGASITDAVATTLRNTGGAVLITQT